MAFLEISFELRTLDPEQTETLCFALGALSVTYADAKDDPVLEPLPGEFRLWPSTRLKALFPEDADADVISAALERTDITVARIEDKIWEREWLKDFHAMRFGRRLWVCPHHETVDAPDAVVVRLDPGLAFGTGTHATTALCLEWLDAHIQPGMRVIDFGCGSGVLAVAAVKLGAQEAHGFDIDPQALLATRENAAVNDVSQQIKVVESADDLPAGVDVVVANILSGPLCDLAPRFASLVRPGGHLVLAGLMEHEAADVTRAQDACFDMATFAMREGWAGLSGRRRF